MIDNAGAINSDTADRAGRNERRIAELEKKVETLERLFGQTEAAEKKPASADAEKIAAALKIAAEYLREDAAHHKAFRIDQMVRALTGCPMVEKTALDYQQQPYVYEVMGESPEYVEFVARRQAEGREWDAGIAP